MVAKNGFNHWFLPVKTGWQKRWVAKSDKKIKSFRYDFNVIWSLTFPQVTLILCESYFRSLSWGCELLLKNQIFRHTLWRLLQWKWRDEAKQVIKIKSHRVTISGEDSQLAEEIMTPLRKYTYLPAYVSRKNIFSTYIFQCADSYTLIHWYKTDGKKLVTTIFHQCDVLTEMYVPIAGVYKAACH